MDGLARHLLPVESSARAPEQAAALEVAGVEAQHRDVYTLAAGPRRPPAQARNRPRRRAPSQLTVALSLLAAPRPRRIGRVTGRERAGGSGWVVPRCFCSESPVATCFSAEPSPSPSQAVIPIDPSASTTMHTTRVGGARPSERCR
jgi:hypothetical protein